MIGKFLFFMSAAIVALLGLSAGAVTTSQSIDIIVTHGGPLTTFTFVNNTGKILPAGSPVSFGQGFRYGDVMPGTFPLIRDASTHVALPGQQWDEISTWRENGGNGSWRHAVWAAWLPNSLANGATYQVEFVATAGSYSQSSHQALSALCSGPAAHDLKIHLTDVRNQNDTVRDSGDATFRLCDNIANVGRDAPRHLRAGHVYDEYQINGLFVYTSGHKDPLLYAQCIVDIFTQASDGVSPGDVRWVCEPSNSWMNVAAGSTGNAGNPGPAGFANDPQSISYRPEIDDGSASVLDWSGLDATVSSASNPIQPAGSAGCYSGFGDAFCMNVPTSTGSNLWYSGQAVRASCPSPNVCPAGMNDGQLYYVYPTGQMGSRSFASTYNSLLLSPNVTYGAARFMTAAQGSGTTGFSFRVQHFHWTTWPTLDWTGLENWSPLGTASRVTRKVYPAFTAAEKRYWEETGLILPMNLAQPVNNFTPGPGDGLSPYYEPNGAGNVIGGTGPGDRADLGIVNEWAAQAFIVGGEQPWDYARLFTLGTPTHGISTYLNEATGRIPAINNGPPTGPGGNGTGGSYAGLGAPQNQVTLAFLAGLADVPHDQPNPAYPASGGQWQSGGFGTYISHMPSFDGFTYMVFGDRHWLDMMRWHGNRDYSQQRTGPGPELGQGYLRDNNARFTDGNIYHYYGLLIDCCQGRGSAWMMRDIIYPATFGSDNDIERSYFNDFLVETRNYYPMWLKFKDGPGNTNYSTSIIAPDGPGEGVGVEPFIASYIFDAGWDMVTFLHEPLGSTWMTKFQRYYEGTCGAQLAGALPYYCLDYYYSPQINNGADGAVTSQQGSTGLYSNGTDATDFGTMGSNTSILTGGQLSVNFYVIAPGDKVMSMTNYHVFGPLPAIDQLSGKWYPIIGPVDNSQDPRTFYIQCDAADHAAFPAQCPVAGGPFTGFTRGGVPIANEIRGETMRYRLAYDPGAGGRFSSPNYEQYGGQNITGLHILGYNVTHALSDFATRGGQYNSQLPINWWDPTIVIPGLPTPVNGL
jgi:hypothetical protein